MEGDGSSSCSSNKIKGIVRVLKSPSPHSEKNTKSGDKLNTEITIFIHSGGL